MCSNTIPSTIVCTGGEFPGELPLARFKGQLRYFSVVVHVNAFPGGHDISILDLFRFLVKNVRLRLPFMHVQVLISSVSAHASVVTVLQHGVKLIDC